MRLQIGILTNSETDCRSEFSRIPLRAFGNLLSQFHVQLLYFADAALAVDGERLTASFRRLRPCEQLSDANWLSVPDVGLYIVVSESETRADGSIDIVRIHGCLKFAEHHRELEQIEVGDFARRMTAVPRSILHPGSCFGPQMSIQRPASDRSTRRPAARTQHSRIGIRFTDKGFVHIYFARPEVRRSHARQSLGAGKCAAVSERGMQFVVSETTTNKDGVLLSPDRAQPDPPMAVWISQVASHRMRTFGVLPPPVGVCS